MKIKHTIFKSIFFLAIIASIGILTYNNYFLYHKTIGVVKSSENSLIKTKVNSDGNRDFEEKYYSQTIKVVIKNGENKGKALYLKNDFTSSGVYDMKYKKGDQLFIEGNKITGVKRDTYVVLVLSTLFGLFLMVGGASGILTIFSLIANLLAFFFVIYLYTKGINILYATIPMTIFFTGMLLFFMYGRNIKTYLSFFSTLITVFLVTGISLISIKFGSTIDFDFMEYLNQPYTQIDATYILLSEILIGSLGAVMDIVVTMTITVDQIYKTGISPGKKDFISSCRNLGDDLVGTMIGLMFFTNIAAGIPFFMLALRNGIPFLTIIKHNMFFDLMRFLTGSIGIVLAIPISSGIAIYFYRKTNMKINGGDYL